MSTIERLAKMAQETTPDQWVSIFSELHEQIVDLEQQLEAAERRNAEQDVGIVLTEVERASLRSAMLSLRYEQESLRRSGKAPNAEAALNRHRITIESLLARAGATSQIGETEKADAAE